LIALEDALREVNRVVNPDFELELLVAALEDGSFRARLRIIKRRLREDVAGILQHPVRNIVLPVFIGIMLQPPQEAIKIEAGDDAYVVTRGSDRIILPKDVRHYAEKARGEVKVRRSVDRFEEVVSQDQAVESLSLGPEGEDGVPVPLRGRYGLLPTPPAPTVVEQVGDRRVVLEKDQVLVILKIVLERGSRKWQFFWQGAKISAPICDPSFFDRLERREIAFAQGDALVADLRVKQVLDRDASVYVNESYEVVYVRDVKPAPSQLGLPIDE
jgi:hypothetical protein